MKAWLHTTFGSPATTTSLRPATTCGASRSPGAALRPSRSSTTIPAPTTSSAHSTPDRAERSSLRSPPHPKGARNELSTRHARRHDRDFRYQCGIERGSGSVSRSRPQGPSCSRTHLGQRSRLRPRFHREVQRVPPGLRRIHRRHRCQRPGLPPARWKSPAAGLLNIGLPTALFGPSGN